jgi:hypothetical protein
VDPAAQGEENFSEQQAKMSILENLTGGHPIAGSLVVTLAVLLGYQFLVAVRYPANLPRVREKPGATGFSLRTRLDYYLDCKSLIFEAYEKVRVSR